MLGMQKNQATEPYWDGGGGASFFLRYVRTRISPHVVKSGFRNARNFCEWNSESEIFLLVGSGNLGFGIRNTAQGVRNPTNDLESEIQ